MPAYQPPFQLTHRMTAQVADIAERLGAWKAANRGALVPELRRGNRIRSLQASLASGSASGGVRNALTASLFVVHGSRNIDDNPGCCSRINGKHAP